MAEKGAEIKPLEFDAFFTRVAEGLLKDKTKIAPEVKEKIISIFNKAAISDEDGNPTTYSASEKDICCLVTSTVIDINNAELEEKIEPLKTRQMLLKLVLDNGIEDEGLRHRIMTCTDNELPEVKKEIMEKIKAKEQE